MEIGYGIDLSGLNLLIEKIDFLYDEGKKSYNKISESIIELSESLGGSSLDLIYSVVNAQNDNTFKVNSTLKSYLNLLDKLKDTYVLQNQAFSSEIESKIHEICNYDDLLR